MASNFVTKGVRTVKEALLDTPVEETTSFIGMLHKIGKQESYKNKEGQDRSFTEVTIVDKTSPAKIKLYRKNALKEGRTYRFNNVIRKFGGFWAISSTITVVANMDKDSIPPEIMDECTSYAMEETPNTLKNLDKALKST